MKIILLRLRYFVSGMALIIISSLLPGIVIAGPADTLLYGNVYGTITARSSGSPIADAEVLLTEMTASRAIAALAASDPVPTVRKANSGPDGRFLVNSVPIQGTTHAYTLVISHPQWDPVVISEVPVLPGAVMSLRVTCRMEKTGTIQSLKGLANTPNATLTYRHLTATRLQSAIPAAPDRPPASAGGPLSLTVFATREGLVGGTTANGHVIQERDRFVALPSRKALCSLGGNEFQVELRHNGRSVIAPVWDIGPWNIHDNYWAPEGEREIYSHLNHGGASGGLGQGLPASQAAYEDNFNSGKDELNRDVANPAGIDLADGTFWDDLGLSDNAWITVRFLWIDGSSSNGCFLGDLLNP